MDAWISDLNNEQLKFISEVAELLESNIKQMPQLSIPEDIHDEIFRRKVDMFSSDPDNFLVKKWIKRKIQEGKVIEPKRVKSI